MTSYEGAAQTVNNSFPGHAIKKSGYTYDANGNAKSRPGQTLYWDVQNRLKEVTNGTSTIESYLYDPDGQRVKKTVGSTNTYYISALYEISGSTVIKYYYFNGQRIAMKKSTTLTYLHADHLGSTVLETNTGGTAIGTMGYYAYGRYRNGSNFSTEHKFTGQKLDGTGLMYFNARYYDREIGAFISPDTIVPDASNLFDYNRYMYVRGRVLNMNDPTGHYSNDEIMDHFGCESWSCVEGNFKEGGSLEGAWGWLNVLQEAEDGDTVTSTMLAQLKGQAGSVHSSIVGSFLFSNKRINVNLQTFAASDGSQSALEGTLDGDAFAQFARNGDYGMYGIKGRTTYGRDVKAACYTVGQCATQTLDAVSTGSAAVAAVCLSSVVGAPCAGIASQVSLYAGITGTAITALSMKDGIREDASALDLGVSMVTTTVGGVFGPAGKGATGVTSSLVQWWWDQGE
jgi:RHS repeat-associated protein